MRINLFQKLSTTVLLLLILTTNGKKLKDLIYILEWSISPETWIYLELEKGQEAFIKRNCTFMNCFLTDNKSYFENLLDFDVLLFNAVHLGQSLTSKPTIRSESQQYAFLGFEPAAYYTIQDDFNSFFNITWTYKLSSDVIHPYVIVKNKTGDIIGPRKYMQWIRLQDDLTPITQKIKSKLSTKTVAAAWIASHCDAKSKRHLFVKKLQKELAEYNLHIDIFGKCGDKDCKAIEGEKNGVITTCSSKIETDYYFYLAFENSFGEDYVTEKILHGLNHYAIPIVYGGANYTRFMPDGIYLNARWLGVKKLAKKMYEIIIDRKKYYEFFKWHNYYSFHNPDEFLLRYSVCEFCAFLNNKTLWNQRTVHKRFTVFWNTEPLPYYDDNSSTTTA